MLRKLQQKIFLSKTPVFTRNYIKHHFDDADFEGIANHGNLNFIILKNNRNNQKETKEEAGFLNALQLYKKNDYQILPGKYSVNLTTQDTHDFPNHLISKVKNHVRIVTRPANKILINTPQEADEMNEDYEAFMEELVKELNIPEMTQDVHNPFADDEENGKKFNESVKEINKSNDEFIEAWGGPEKAYENIQADQQKKNETYDALKEIINEEQAKLNQK